MDSTEFFGGAEPAPDPQGYDSYGRYLLDVDGMGKRPYTRATTLAKALDNTHGLLLWGQRKIAKGVAQSPALTARAAIAPLDDKRVWKEIIDAADVLSGGNEKRDLGSAFHELHERVPNMTGDEYAAVPSDLRVTYERYRAELDRLGITEVLTECTVANTAIGTAGKADAVFRLPDGRLVIGDRKSGRITEYPHSAAVQLAIYANADVLIEYDENGAAARYPMPELDKTTAIVVDVTIGDETTAAVHVYEIDIWSGWSAALLSAKVRRWRNRRDLVTPYHPDVLPAPSPALSSIPTGYAVGAGGVMENGPTPAVPLRTQAEKEADFASELPPPQAGCPVEVAHGPAANSMSATAAAVLGTGPAIGTGDAIQPPHAGAHPAWSSKDQAVIALDSKGDRADVVVGEPHAQLTAPGTADVDALLTAFKTKAAMQEAGRRVGLTNLSRTRANLAKDMVAHPAWPSLRAALLPAPGPSVPGVGTVVAQTNVVGEDVVLSATVSNAPGPVPPDPEPGYAATGQSDSEAFTNSQNTGDPHVQGPPRPAADNPFVSAPAAEPAKTTEDTVLEQIAAAASQQDLAQAWQTANDAGIGWPARLHQAATIMTQQFNQKGPTA